MTLLEKVLNGDMVKCIHIETNKVGQISGQFHKSSYGFDLIDWKIKYIKTGKTDTGCFLYKEFEEEFKRCTTIQNKLK